VRLLSYSRLRSSLYFNPRTHVGCDMLELLKNYPGTLFQSTHPCRVRLFLASLLFFCCRDFNPRTHVGCDSQAQASVGSMGNFNPRTHVGCDFSCAITLGLCCYFNPRTHVGCDRRVLRTLFSPPNFNPRTHVGCDPYFFVADTKTMTDFNPRTHVGCDSGSWLNVKAKFSFQSTHPCRVRRIAVLAYN